MAIKYVITKRNLFSKNHFVATQAVTDITTISNEIGYKNIERNITDKKYLNVVLDIIFFIKLLFLPQNAELLYQHPLYNLKSMEKIFFNILKLKKFKITTIIHDLDMLRINGKSMEIDEINLLKVSENLIVHNNSMKSFLVSKGFEESKIIELEIFDYLVDELSSNIKKEEAINPKSLIVAGNLIEQKCGYLYKLIEENNFFLDVYGVNYKYANSCEKYTKTKYHGAFPASELPHILNGGFGLVWDGDSVETCSGVYGEYLRINNPHKLSLYLTSGIPVIVWKYSAMAEFVLKNNVGFAVENINDAESIINDISDVQYNTLKTNAENIGKLLKQGYYLKKAICAIDIN